MTVKTLRDLTFELMKYILLESFTEIFRRGDKDYYCLTPKEREKDFLKEVNVTLVKNLLVLISKTFLIVTSGKTVGVISPTTVVTLIMLIRLVDIQNFFNVYLYCTCLFWQTKYIY